MAFVQGRMPYDIPVLRKSCHVVVFGVDYSVLFADRLTPARTRFSTLRCRAELLQSGRLT